MSNRALLAVQIIIAFVGLRTARASTPGPWIAFRYSPNEVLFYPGKMKDPTGFSNEHLERGHLSQPLARWGGGGYLMPVNLDRLAIIERVGGTNPLEDLHVGDKLAARLDRRHSVNVVIERFVEQWGGENPVVQIGVIAQIEASDLPLFLAAKSDYFLAYYGFHPQVPNTAVSNPVVGPRRVLNDFGRLGKLVPIRGDDGWNIALWREISGELRPTSVMYAYGD